MQLVDTPAQATCREEIRDWVGVHGRDLFGPTLLGPDATVVGDGWSLDRFQSVFPNSRAETIYGGANEIQRNIVAERLLGLPKDARA